MLQHNMYIHKILITLFHKIYIMRCFCNTRESLEISYILHKNLIMYKQYHRIVYNIVYIFIVLFFNELTFNYFFNFYINQFKQSHLSYQLLKLHF